MAAEEAESLIYCPEGGHLVNADMIVPTDPTDRDVPNGVAVGCNRLRCDPPTGSGCGADIRHAPGLDFRLDATRTKEVLTAIYETDDLAGSPLLQDQGDVTRRPRFYLCKCSYWVEDFRHVCQDSDDDFYYGSTDPDMPWRCTGHPPLTLPHDFNGVFVSSRAGLRDLAWRGLRGLHPPRTRQNDVPDTAWVCRLALRLPAEDAAVVVEAALEALDDPNPEARARALEIFRMVPSEPAYDKLVTMLAADRRGFAGVPIDQLAHFAWDDNDETLEDAAWRAVAPRIADDDRLRELARGDALAGRGSAALFRALARYDGEWLAGHVEQIARLAPTRVENLVSGLRRLPDSMPSEGLREQAARIAPAALGRVVDQSDSVSDPDSDPIVLSQSGFQVNFLWGFMTLVFAAAAVRVAMGGPISTGDIVWIVISGALTIGCLAMMRISRRHPEGLEVTRDHIKHFYKGKEGSTILERSQGDLWILRKRNGAWLRAGDSEETINLQFFDVRKFQAAAAARGWTFR